jgi:hypothetical protein
VTLVGKEQPRAARAKDRGDLRRFVGGVERNRDRADAQDPEIGRAPARVVVSEDRDAIAEADPVRGQPGADAFGGAAELAVRDAVDAIAPLDLYRDAVATRCRGLVEEGEEGTDAGIIMPGRRGRKEGKGRRG